MSTREYAIVYEWAGSNYSAYVPDLPGCVACGDTLEETADLMQEAVGLYLAALKEADEAVPEARSSVGCVKVTV